MRDLNLTEQQEKIIRVFVVDTKTKACSAIIETLACLLFCIASCQTQTRVVGECGVLTGYLRKLIEEWKSLVFTQNIFWITRHHHLVQKFIEFVLQKQVSRNPIAFRATFIIFNSISPFYLAPYWCVSRSRRLPTNLVLMFAVKLFLMLIITYLAATRIENPPNMLATYILGTLLSIIEYILL